MGALEDLVNSLLSSDTENAISQNNSYLNYSHIADAIAQGAIKGATQGDYGLKDKALSVGLSSLISGAAEGYADRKQNELESDYAKTVQGLLSGDTRNTQSLPPDLFRRASKTATLFALKKAKEDAKMRKVSTGDKGRDKDREIILRALIDAKKPEDARRILTVAQAMGVLEGQDGASAQSQSSDGDLKKVGFFSDLVGQFKQDAPEDITSDDIASPLADKINAVAKKLINQGATPSQAYQTARQLVKPDVDRQDRSYKAVEEAAREGAKLALLADKADMALQDAGDTGVLGEAKQTVAGYLGMLGIDDQQQKYEAGARLKSLEPDVIAMRRNVLKGPMSDRDVNLLLRGGVSMSHPRKTNQSIINAWRYAAKLQQNWASFMRDRREMGVPLSQAEREWEQIRAANPYVIKDERTKKLTINPAWAKGEVDSYTAPSGPILQPSKTQKKAEPKTLGIEDFKRLLEAGKVKSVKKL